MSVFCGTVLSRYNFSVFRKWFFVSGMIFGLGFLQGCSLGRTIDYPLAEADRVKRSSPIPLRLLVATVKDSRHNRERVGRADGQESTRDKYFKNVSGGVSEMIAKHLGHSGLFADVQVASFATEQATPEQLARVADKFDLVLLGELEHFFGVVYRSSTLTIAGKALGLGGGLAGGVIVAGVDASISKDVEAHALLKNLRLVRATTGEVLWVGDAESKFKRDQRGLPDPSDLAIEALQSAVTVLVQRLNEANLQPN